MFRTANRTCEADSVARLGSTASPDNDATREEDEMTQKCRHLIPLRHYVEHERYPHTHDGLKEGLTYQSTQLTPPFVTLVAIFRSSVFAPVYSKHSTS